MDITTNLTEIKRIAREHSMNAEKAFGKIQHPLTIKIIRKLGIEGNFIHDKGHQ